MEGHPLYDFMKKNNLTTKDEATFLKEYSTPEKANELHKFFTENELTTKDSASFYKEYFGEPPGKSKPDGSGAPSGGLQQPVSQPSSAGQPTGSRAFDPLAKFQQQEPAAPAPQPAPKPQMDITFTEEQMAPVTDAQKVNVPLVKQESFSEIEKPAEYDPRQEIKDNTKEEEQKESQRKLSVAQKYEEAQRAYADETKFNLNVYGTAEKYLGKPFSQNFEQQRQEVAQIQKIHEKELEEKRKQTDYYQWKTIEEIKPVIADLLAGKKGDFIMKSDAGFDVVNTNTVAEQANHIAGQYGQPTDSYFRRMVYNQIKNEVSFKLIEDDVNKVFKAKASPILKENERKIEEGFSTDEVESQKYQEATKLLAADLSMQQQAEADIISKEYKAAMDSGANPSYEEYLAQLNVINSRYNKRYEREAQELEKIAEANIKKAAEEYSKNLPQDPEFEKKLKELYNEAYKEVYSKRQSDISATDQFIGSVPGGDVYMLLRSSASGLGGSFKGLGASLGMESLEKMGEYLEQRYTIAPPNIEGLSDLFNTTNLAKLSGQLAGGMAPSMIASAVTTTLTGGLGAGASAQMITGGLASFTAETADITGRAYIDAFEKTGNAGDAEEAARKSFNSQMDIVLAYALDAAPFVKGSLSSIKSQAGRVAAGGTIEFATELTQEMLQNIAEENISKGGEAWDGLSEKITDPTRIKQTAISISPVAGMGSVGQIGSKSKAEMLADFYLAQQSKSKMKTVIEDQGRQFVQGMVFKEGESTTLAMINSLYSSGQITSLEMDAMVSQVKEAKSIQATADEAKLSDNDRDIYAFYSSRAAEASRKSAETKDPILSKVYSQQAKDYENAAVDFLQGNDPDFLSIKYKDGSQYLMTPEDMRNATKTASLQRDIENGNVEISAFGKDGKKLVDNLGVTIEKNKQERIAKQQQKANTPVYTGLSEVELEIKKGLGERIYTDRDIDTMVEEKQIIEDCPPRMTKAEYGARDHMKAGGKWQIVEEFKGKTHKEGGIDIEISGGMVKYGGDGGKKMARGGFWNVLGDIGKFAADRVVGIVDPQLIKASDYDTKFFKNASVSAEAMSDLSPLAKATAAIRKDTPEERMAGMTQEQVDVYNKTTAIAKPIMGAVQSIAGAAVPGAGLALGAINAALPDQGPMQLPANNISPMAVPSNAIANINGVDYGYDQNGDFIPLT